MVLSIGRICLRRISDGELNMPARIVKGSVFLESQMLDIKDPHGLELEYDAGTSKEETCVFIHTDTLEFLVQEIEGGPKRLYLSPNAQDPENPVTAKDVANNILDMVDHGKFPVKDIAPTSYYGTYIDTLQEALDTVYRWMSIPVRDWPKEYNKPHPYVGS